MLWNIRLLWLTDMIHYTEKKLGLNEGKHLNGAKQKHIYVYIYIYISFFVMLLCICNLVQNSDIMYMAKIRLILI